MPIVTWETTEQLTEIERYYSYHSSDCIKKLQFV